MTANISRPKYVNKENINSKIFNGAEKKKTTVVKFGRSILDSFSVIFRPPYIFLNFRFLGCHRVISEVILNTINIYFITHSCGSPFSLYIFGITVHGVPNHFFFPFFFPTYFYCHDTKNGKWLVKSMLM